jgi:tRNA-2-methylthio-N6-dimethylallyladenosine synthase
MVNKKYHIKTWGCQMNEYDSKRIGEVLQSLNYEETDILSESDIVVLNTCHIREKATEKVYSDIGRLKILKDKRKLLGQNLIIAVSGCVAQAEGDEIIKRAPCVDLVFGPQTWHKLKDMITQVEETHKKVCNTDFPVEEKFDNLPKLFDKNRVVNNSAFIAIQEGCDKFCTYCVVPYTRGAEYSRPTWQVLGEVEQLVNAGAKEITLLGQNVNAYHGMGANNEQWSLGRLIRRLAEMKDLHRIRYVTSYPAEVDDDLINAHRDVEKLMPFLHLPIQSGSNIILKAMNRNHSAEQYLKLVDRLLKVNSKLAFSSDFIVGFPGESDKDFEDSLNIIKQVGFIQSFSFSYSIRPGTPAGLMENQIPEHVKAERLTILQNELAKSQQKFNDNSLGKNFEILLDREGKLANQLVGKSPYMQAVRLNDVKDAKLGDIVNVKIVGSAPNSLVGELLGNK